MGRLLATALIAWLCQGCFVLEELDKSQASMDRHSGRMGPHEVESTESDRQPVRGTREKEPDWIATWTDRVDGWWQEAWQREPVESDPDDIVVRCSLGDGTRFTRKSDCLVRGGRIL
ncbi:MAG: hypothetical protein QF890_01140 [Myxococcota bacterium]|jgi:hypothetical protein|nr:hypothetical protein [bacterium]MDP6074914.1 hypothetical protein [Myxococcota bacterium]MDP6241881.1 hypothetical protein [Myxococcota bacterium]MDP7074315.1 hypothetical protein [Myxococcota bacterium]MDP7300859.1 hypothetical protein [Myxococcota bacterium]